MSSPTNSPGRTGRAIVAVFGVACYAAFLLSLVIVLVAFAPLPLHLSFVTPIDERPATPIDVAWVVDVALLLAFGLQHSVMARGWFKRALTVVVPASAERSVFVLASAIALGGAAWAWRPLPGTIWSLSELPAPLLVLMLFGLGLVLMTASTLSQGHAELFGLRQSVGPLLGVAPREAARLRTPMLYRVVRHPLMLGVLITLWATPTLTTSHALFAAGMTVYALAGVRFEERDLLRTFGEAYERYRREVPMLLPFPRRRR